jgi:CPW-WPC domain-containing protein
MAKFVAALTCLASVASAADSVVELSIASPANGYPTFSGAVASADGERASNEAANMKAVTLAFEAAQKSALGALSAALGGSSFIHFNPVEPTLRVSSHGGAADEGSAKGEYLALESDRAQSETALFQQAKAEFTDIAKVVINEYKKARSSFLQGSGYAKELNVRVMGNANYNTISRLAESSEARRDVAEDYYRAKILDLQMQLVKSLNAAAATMMSKSFLRAPSSPFLAGLDKQISAQFPGESLSSIHAVLSDALDAALAVEDVPTSYGECIRNFSGCPTGFANLGNGKCQPPAWYQGNCEGPVDFAGLTPQLKTNLADSCAASFPCA